MARPPACREGAAKLAGAARVQRSVPRLRIPTRCPERWQDMEVRAGGRYCASCERTLLDLRGLSRARVEAMVRRAGGDRVCALAHVDPRTREIWYPPSTEPAPRLGVVLAAALTVSACSEPAPRDGGVEIADAGASMRPIDPGATAPDVPRSRAVPADELERPPDSPEPTPEQRARTERKHPPAPAVVPHYVLEEPGYVI